MKERMMLMKQWVTKRSERDQFYMFLAGLACIYLIFMFMFNRPITRENDEIRAKIAELSSQKTSIQQQIETLTQSIEDPLFIQMINAQKRLTESLKGLEGKLVKLKPKVILPQNIPNIIENVLSVANPSIDFVKLEELPVELWLKSDADKAALSGIVNDELYTHSFRIEFLSDYFSTLHYLSSIEKLPWPIYWDTLEYKVLQYPKADVSITFHVLSIQKS